MSHQEFYESLGLVDRKEAKRQRRLRQWRQQRRDRCLSRMAFRITGFPSVDDRNPGPADSEPTDDELEYHHMMLLAADAEPLDEVL